MLLHARVLLKSWKERFLPPRGLESYSQPMPLSGSLQPLVTPVSWHVTPSSGLQRHLHTQDTHTQTHTHKIIK